MSGCEVVAHRSCREVSTQEMSPNRILPECRVHRRCRGGRRLDREGRRPNREEEFLDAHGLHLCRAESALDREGMFLQRKIPSAPRRGPSQPRNISSEQRKAPCALNHDQGTFEKTSFSTANADIAFQSPFSTAKESFSTAKESVQTAKDFMRAPHSLEGPWDIHAIRCLSVPVHRRKLETLPSAGSSH